MSKFPVESNDGTGIRDAVNYLLSGPGGLGQNFQGFSAYTTGYITGNFRVPYNQNSPALLYVAPIACSSAVQIDDRTFQYNFASTQPAPPFALGNNTFGTGWTNSFYNGGSGAIGVIKCTEDFVIIRTNQFYPGIGDDLGGGFVEYNAMDQYNSTDCNARVIVTGATDRVFISGQLSNVMSYIDLGGGGDIIYYAEINRYVGFPNNDPINPDFIFELDETVARKAYPLSGLSGSGTLSEIETVFTAIVDSPLVGYYWYILEIYIETDGDIVIEMAETNLRSLSAQVVKQ